MKTITDAVNYLHGDLVNLPIADNGSNLIIYRRCYKLPWRLSRTYKNIDVVCTVDDFNEEVWQMMLNYGFVSSCDSFNYQIAIKEALTKLTLKEDLVEGEAYKFDYEEEKVNGIYCNNGFLCQDGFADVEDCINIKHLTIK
jgi:hypothetical protein